MGDDVQRALGRGGIGGATGADQGTVRRHNLSIVLGEILDAETPPSRADIAHATGLGKGTVTALIDALLTAGLIRELSPVGALRAGRPAVPLAPARATYASLGLEVNAEYLGVRAIDLSGSLLAQTVIEMDNRHSRPGATFDQLRSAVRQVAEVVEADGCRITGACLAVPGVVERWTGMLRVSPALGWIDTDLFDELKRAGIGDGHPIRVGNAASLAAAAEAALVRAERLSQDFILVRGDQELGAAVVLQGEVQHGKRGRAGEFGHQSIDPRGPACPCGRRGCLEQYVGLGALWRGAGRRGAPDAVVLLSLLEAGDRATLRAVHDAADILGRALAAPVGLLDVDTVVLDGLLASLVPFVAPTLKDQLRRRVYGGEWSPVEVRGSLAGRWSVLTGAARDALLPLVRDPGRWIADLTGA